MTSSDPEVQGLLFERMRRVIDLAAWEALVMIGGIRGTLTGTEGEQADQSRRAVDAVRGLA